MARSKRFKPIFLGLFALAVVLAGHRASADELGVPGVGSCAAFKEMRVWLESQQVTADFRFPDRDWFADGNSALIVFWSSENGKVIVVTRTDQTRSDFWTCIVLRGGPVTVGSPRIPAALGRPI